MKIFGNVIKLLIVIIILTFVFIIYILPYRVLMGSPFSFDEMDINKNGFLSPTEAEYYADYGTKEYVKDRKQCVEYYAYKDGVELKTVCK